MRNAIESNGRVSAWVHVYQNGRQMLFVLPILGFLGALNAHPQTTLSSVLMSLYFLAPFACPFAPLPLTTLTIPICPHIASSPLPDSSLFHSSFPLMPLSYWLTPLSVINTPHFLSWLTNTSHCQPLTV